MKTNFDPYNLDIDTLGFYMVRTLSAMIKNLNKELKDTGLNFQHSDFTIMRILNKKDGLTQSELADILGKQKSGISRSLNSLEKNGYIIRSAYNGCTNKVSLSDKGKNIIPQIDKIANHVTDIAFHGFPEKKREEMLKNLTKIYKNSRLRIS